jgi:hypothetical protein
MALPCPTYLLHFGIARKDRISTLRLRRDQIHLVIAGPLLGSGPALIPGAGHAILAQFIMQRGKSRP